MITVDVRGLGCPVPVIRTKEAMEKNPDQTINVLLDSEAAKENVSRMAQSKKYAMKIEQGEDEEYKLVLTPAK
ncbi:MAG TPA: sulfurtransferase TusA family protein [Smithellaceae bacterium]|nr:sulfurtransferase TusA family protein [Smithellaceae bacterium]HNT91952.1 sulfurtransferase TusA family protein [Smithellaceae bacterium]HOF77165.1 sulfurtransferase TusA family protein [Smithellaceae bacterium]HOM70475.1 sulfurtransferase TusA family protein [Smithellaceae bacterium]HOS08278.1 sulfurtransferase TusA family protein [Smithellaceae bacterium]